MRVVATVVLRVTMMCAASASCWTESQTLPRRRQWGGLLHQREGLHLHTQEDDRAPA